MGPARERHPWNESFTWTDHAGPFSTVTADDAARFDRDGFLVIPDAFDAEVLARLDAEIAPGEQRVRELLEQVPGGRFSVAGLDTQTVAPHLVLASRWLAEFCAHPLLAGLCRDLVGPDVRLYWEQAVYKQPHSAAPVRWHQDNGYAYVEPQAYLTCWIAITDVTPEHGCIRVMPGVHREGTLRHDDTPDGAECWADESLAVEVPVTAGSIVVFSSLTPHATAANRTDDVRKAYIVQYCHDGAVLLQGDPTAAPTARLTQDDPARQPLVVRDGALVGHASP